MIFIVVCWEIVICWRCEYI